MANIAIADDWSHEARRAYERHSVNSYLRVIDLDSSTLLGNVVDISLSGIKLASAAPIPVKTTCRVRLDIALGEDDEAQVVFVSTCVGGRADLTSGLYESGWRNTLSPEALRGMQGLIDRITSMEG